MRTTVRSEQTGWRDLAFSRRHREYGIDCPATDIDCLVEIARGVPAAIIEYKKANANLEASYQSVRSLEILADRARLPFFVVLYRAIRDRWFFRIVHANSRGFHLLSPLSGSILPVNMAERDFVRFLYTIRGRDPEAVESLPIFRKEEPCAP